MIRYHLYTLSNKHKHHLYSTLLLRNPVLPRRRPYPLKIFHMLRHSSNILLPQHIPGILRAIPPIIKTLRKIPIQPSQKICQVGMTCFRATLTSCGLSYFFCHDGFDTYQDPLSTVADQIEEVRIQKPTQHKHKLPNEFRVNVRPPIPITMGGKTNLYS